MEQFNSFAQKHNDHIVLTKRQVSMVMASMILCGLFVFITGFFLGKRTVIQDFSAQVTQNSLHDQIDFLLTSNSLQSFSDGDDLGDEIPGLEPVIGTGSLIDDPAASFDIVLDNKKEEVIASQAPILVVAKEEKSEAIRDAVQGTLSGDAQERQYACLIGFGTKKAALTFVARLQKNNIELIIKTMISKTATGKQRTWYQVITPTYSNRAALDQVVGKIKKLEHIRDIDIKIVHVK